MDHATIANLLALVVPPDNRTDEEIAGILDVGLAPLRARLGDLKARGIVKGPFETTSGGVWTSWFPTQAETLAAAARSGLQPDALVSLRRPWWRCAMDR